MINFDGYTTDPTLTEQARNVAARLRAAVGEREAARITGACLAKHGYICPEFVRELDGITRTQENDPRTHAQKDADQLDAEWRETYQTLLP